MKQLFMILLLAVSTVSTHAADQDTLTIQKPQRVRIITGDSIQKITVYGREGDEKYSYENTIQLVDSNYVSSVNINKDRWDLSISVGSNNDKGFHNEISSHIGVGLCNPISACFNGSSSVGSSFEIFWTIAQWDHFSPKYKNWYSFGFGVDWRNYRMNGRSHFMKQTDGTLTEEHYPDGYDPIFSRIKVFSLNVPLLFGHEFSKGLSLTVGPVLNFNTYASIKNRYFDNQGERHTDVYKAIHQKPVTIDFMAIVELLNLKFYGKYSPMNTLNSTYGKNINFQSVSFGIYL